MGALSLYTGLFVLGVVLIVISTNYFAWRNNMLGDIAERYIIFITTRDISIPLAGGTTITVNVAKNDRVTAWRIYTQIKTRIAAIDFNPEYDSILLVHESLHKVFDLIREEIAGIPIERVQRDRSDSMVRFYLDILNEGIRPHLSKWHIPLKNWVEVEQKKFPDRSILEIEKKFPERKEILESIKAMNQRMKKYADELLKIAKGG